ncbi:MAG: hypothetical protein R6U17_01595 [Thermoplasmata archaeon]
MQDMWLSITGAFFVALIVSRWQIKTFPKAGINGKDMHKHDKNFVAEMGGLAAIIGFMAGISIVLGRAGEDLDSALFLTSIIAIIGAGFIGMVDDMVSLRQKTKAILPFIFAIPLGIHMMDHTITIFTFEISTSYFILLAVPFGVTCAANAANMLEGFNGLGSGLSAISSITLIILIYINNGPSYGLFILFPLLGATLGFSVFNLYPSRIFPGDTFTLFSGAAISSAAIISELITPGIILFVPMIIEFVLKFRGGFQAENFANMDEKRYLVSVHDKTESITHFIVKKVRVKEWQLVSLVWIMEAVLGVSVIVLYIYL